jgi:hypothetical protein
MMWTFDQSRNLETSRDPVFIAAKISLLAGFIVLSPRTGRKGAAGVGDKPLCGRPCC